MSPMVNDWNSENDLMLEDYENNKIFVIKPI